MLANGMLPPGRIVLPTPLSRRGNGILVDREGIEPNRLATQHIKATDLQSAVGNTVHIFW